MYMQWDSDLDTGIAEIDEQHHQILDHINALHRAQQGGDRSEVATVLEGLVDYTVNHFSFEEKLMEEAGYDYLGAHQRVHELFGKRVADYRTRFAEGEDITEELLGMLKGWLFNHIRTEDSGYLSDVKEVVEDEGKKKWVSGLLRKFFG